ncbi:GNAT family N-acetyltransferase [Candidatus Gracilibacteria bacterium]|nr:GNAT family N-acetyltransferase [Candidatus Gracilibacteria bacterium]
MSFATHIITPYEYVAYATHLKRLSKDDRYCRFRTFTSDETIEAYVKKIQNNPNEIVIAHYGDDCGIDGSLQLSIIENTIQEVRKKIAELSMSVLPESRGKGIADTLIEHAILHARTLQVEQLVTTCNPSNKTMLHIAKRIGMEIDGDFEEKNAELLLQKPGIETISLDIFRQQLGTIDYVNKKTANAVSEIWKTFYTNV